MYFNRIFLLFYIFYCVAGAEDDTVQIGNSIYIKEIIPEYTGFSDIRRIGVNSAGDIYTWSGFKPQYLKVGASQVEYVPGLKNSVIHGFVLDSKDNFFFCRLFVGCAFMKPGQKEEAVLAGVHATANTIVIDKHDNMYLGAQYWVQRIELAENFDQFEESTTIWIDGFEYGFRVPAAIDSKNNIYYRQGFGYFYYQNIDEGSSSRRRIPEIGYEEANGASVDSKDNAYVATEKGLFYIKAGSKGVGIEKVEAFADKFIGSVHVDWWKNDTIYLAIENEGVFRLTYGWEA